MEIAKISEWVKYAQDTGETVELWAQTDNGPKEYDIYPIDTFETAKARYDKILQDNKNPEVRVILATIAAHQYRQDTGWGMPTTGDG